MQEGQTREQWLLHILERDKDWRAKWTGDYVNHFHQIKRGFTLATLATFPEMLGLKSYFVDGDLSGMKQHFYVATKLMQASQKEDWDSFSTYEPFLYGLLSDSSEIINWLIHAELKNKTEVKHPHFRFYQFQLLLRGDDSALRETIELAAKKGGKQDRKEFSSGTDFFSLVLKRDKAGLETLIENQAKIKSADEHLNRFFAGLALISAKLCWIRGIEVEINNPLVPMPMLPVQPLDQYDVEYDFLRPGWAPPNPSLLDKLKRLLK